MCAMSDFWEIPLHPLEPKVWILTNIKLWSTSFGFAPAHHPAKGEIPMSWRGDDLPLARISGHLWVYFRGDTIRLR